MALAAFPAVVATRRKHGQSNKMPYMVVLHALLIWKELLHATRMLAQSIVSSRHGLGMESALSHVVEAPGKKCEQ